MARVFAYLVSFAEVVKPALVVLLAEELADNAGVSLLGRAGKGL